MSSKRTCPHGQTMTQDASGIDADELDDPNDFGILAYYSVCDCCGVWMHTDSPGDGGGIIQDNGQLFCASCDEGERGIRGA